MRGTGKRRASRGPARVLALAIVLSVAACSSDRAPDSPQSDSPPPVAARRLRVLAEDSATLAAFEKTKVGYERTAGVSIEIIHRDHPALMADIRGKPGVPQAAYDLLIVPSRVVGELVARGNVQPIEDFLREPALHDPRLFDPQSDLFPGWWTELSWYGGQPYGFPFQLRPMSLWYREDLLDEEHEAAAFERRYGRVLTFPRNPAELEQVVEFFHRPSEGLYGTVVAGRSTSLPYDWLTYASMFGATLFESSKSDRYGDIVVNSPQAVRATEFYLRLLRFSPPDSRSYDEKDAVRAFETRQVAIGIMRHDLAFTGEPPDPLRRRGGINYTRVPAPSGGSATAIDGDTFLIPRETAQAREAFSLMEWALSEDAQVALTLNGGLAARRSSFTDPRVTALPKTHRSVPFMQIAIFPRLAAETVAMPTPAIPDADRIVDVMSSGLSRIVAGEVTPKAGLDQIAVGMAQTLKGKAKLRYSVAGR